MKSARIVKPKVDAYVLGDTLIPLSLIMCSPIGAILTEDQDGNDAKIIAVPLTKFSPEFGEVNKIYDLPAFFREKLEHFIGHHKDLESGKFVKGIKWEERYAAEQIILQAIERNR